MKSPAETDEARRKFLLRALGSGLLIGGLGWRETAWADSHEKPPKGRSIFRMEGEVLVNDKPATTSTLIQAGDSIRVGNGGQLVAAVGDTAFLMRQNSTVQLSGARLVIRALKATGALLGVFGQRRAQDAIQVSTMTATIGIRGTGVYFESDPDQSYVCTCYGTTDIAAADDPADRVSVTAYHHDLPKWVLAKPDSSGRRIIPAGLREHTDEELVMLEAVVGRKVPFEPGKAGYGYERPRREEY